MNPPVGTSKPTPHPAMTRLWFFALTLFSISPLAAQFGIEDPLAAGLDEGPAEEWSTARLVSEARTIAAGEPFTVALVLDHPEGWHSYYFNTGGTEKSPEIRWELPEGFSAGPIQWPVPHVIDGLLENKSLTYAGRVVFPVEITPPAELEAGTTVSLTAHPTWQICEQLCKDEPNPDAPQSFTLELPVAGQAADDPEQAALFEQARAALPKPTRAWSFSATSTASGFELRLEPGEGAPEDLGSMKLEFIPDVPYVAPLSDGGSLTREGDQWLITLKRLREVPLIELPIEQGTRISGILEADRPLDTTTGATAIVVPTTEFGKAPPKPLSLGALLPVLLGMFVGGMILNLMPCVFPVLSLKALTFAERAHGHPGEVRRDGLMFLAGVLASFTVLAGVLIALRAAGGAAGWGFQLQSPAVVALLALLFFAISLNLIGAFEFGGRLQNIGAGLAARKGPAGAFFVGVLAVIVATPCTAPFMGAALGYALVQPAIIALSVFLALGAGLAAPFVALAFSPGLLRRLPRPGPWMVRARQLLAFPMAATAIWLVWVLSLLSGADGVAAVLLAMLAFAFAVWAFGAFRRAGVVLGALGLAGAAAGIALAATADAPAGAQMAGGAKLEAEAWSGGRVQAVLAEGRPVFVDFTAAWCVTCQVNERTTLSAGKVVQAFADTGAAYLVADWTARDAEIEQELASHGRSGVPLYLVYSPDGGAPEILPQILTEGRVISALEEAAG